MSTTFGHGERQALANRETIASMVAQYNAGVAQMTAGWEQIAQGLADMERAFGDGAHTTFRLADRSGRSVYLETGDIEASLRRDAWRALVARLNVRAMMSSRRSDELSRQLDRDALPAITEENVSAFVKGYLESLPDMLREAVEDVFEWLRPRGGTRGAGYKTNGPFEVGNKVVLTYCGEVNYCQTGFWLNQYTRPRLLSLESVFKSLDGRGQIVERGASGIEEALRGSLTAETDHFRARAFKNGNIHLEFRRLDLLKRFNALAGGKTLRDKAAE